MKITYAELKAKHACRDQLALFKKLFGAEVEVTIEACLTVADKFSWHWAAQNLLSKKQWAEYDRAMMPAWAAYERAMMPVSAEYRRARASAWTAWAAAYGRAIVLAWAEYERACASASAEYERAIAPVLAEYERACAAAFCHAAQVIESLDMIRPSVLAMEGLCHEAI